MSSTQVRQAFRHFVLFVWLPILALPIQAQLARDAGALFFKQYLPDVYGATPENWAVAQGANGVMFFGNTDGLLEYDGASWRIITMPKRSAVRSLAVDDHGTVYVGGEGEIGFLQGDGAGALHYVSLLDKVAVDDRRFGDVWTVSCTRAGVLFGSYQRIFRWSAATGQMKVWRAASRFGRVFTVEDVPYVVVAGSGLNRLVGNYMESFPGGALHRASGDTLEFVPGGELFKNERWSQVFSYGGSLMVASDSGGLYRQVGKQFVRFATKAEKFLKENTIYQCSPLQNGDLAIGTFKGGLILLRPDGSVDRILSKETGLASNAVYAVYQDHGGSVWLALGRGIAHVQTDLPLTRFNDREGLGEVVLNIARIENTLYAGTMTGLSRLVVSSDAAPSFESVPGIKGQIFGVVSSPAGLLVGGANGIAQVTRAGVERLRSGLIYSLSRSTRDPDAVFAVGSGLYLLRHQGQQWDVVREVAPQGQDFLLALEDPDGRVWVTSRTSILRIDLEKPQPKIERFAGPEGVPPGWNYAYRIEGETVFATAKGLLRFDSQHRRFVPEDRFGRIFADGSHGVSLVRETAAGTIWIGGPGYHGILRKGKDGSYIWDENPLARSQIKELYALHIDPDGVAWASGADGGLVRYDPRQRSTSAADFDAQLTRAQLVRGNQNSNSGDLPLLNLSGASGSSNLPAIPHQQNALRFDFSAPSFEDESRTEYQVHLEGLDHAWSEWSRDTRKEYTNLWEGRYVFHVRARDLHGRISKEAALTFRVLPPWYRTWIAYALYALLFVGCMWLIIWWRLHTLAESNRRLEVIVEERTEEIRRQRDEIKLEEERTEALLLNILPEAVADELRRTGTVRPLAYESLTVCFTDFVGFTVSSETVTASDLVAALHKYFTAFDEIVERYGLEKLKTIGDSYMFVGGLGDRPSHAVDVVMAALEIVDVVAGFSDLHPAWKVRVGIHTGPVVAGVVGVKKFAFDIWGETVNFASRFESSGVPNRVNLSVKTHDLICEFIECVPRGLVRIKEGRHLEMYFANQVRPQFFEDDPEASSSRFADVYQQKFGYLPRVLPSASKVHSVSTA